MMHMTRYKRWDVVVTVFPFADDIMVKRRPALCVAAFSPTRKIELYWVLMITSTTLKGWRGDIEIKNRKKAGLPIPSIVRSAKIACVDGSLIERKAGVLDTNTKTAVHKILQDLVA